MQRHRDRVLIGALPVDPLTFRDALDAIAALVESRRGGTVFTPNVDHVVQAEHDAELREAYQAAELSLVDGVPLLWASRFLGRRLPEKVSGSDLFVPLMGRAAKNGWRVFLLGGAPGCGARAAAVLRQSLPDLRLVGMASPQVSLDDRGGWDEIAEAVHRTRPDLVVVALGAPKQELWSHAMARSLHPAVIVCVGAALDFVAGHVRRSPAWMSRVGLEWSYRLAQEPRRLWKRYLLRGPRFVPVVLRCALEGMRV